MRTEFLRSGEDRRTSRNANAAVQYNFTFQLAIRVCQETTWVRTLQSARRRRRQRSAPASAPVVQCTVSAKDGVRASPTRSHLRRDKVRLRRCLVRPSDRHHSLEPHPAWRAAGLTVPGWFVGRASRSSECASMPAGHSKEQTRTPTRPLAPQPNSVLPEPSSATACASHSTICSSQPNKETIRATDHTKQLPRTQPGVARQ